jgi:hypothetical protein
LFFGKKKLNKYPLFLNYLLLKTIAAITPGTQPTQVNNVVSNTAPQPLSNTAAGGKITQIKALKHPIKNSYSLTKKIITLKIVFVAIKILKIGFCNDKINSYRFR